MSTQFSSEQLDRLKSAMAKLRETTEPEFVAAEEIAVDVPEEEEEGLLAKGSYLKVDEDEMAAWLYLMPPEPEMEYRKQDLIDYLSQNGVVEGLHQSNLSAIIKKKVYNREILVARGREIQDGADGYFEYLFTPEEYGVPKIREDGSVDYTNINALQNVRAGEKVALYHPAIQSVDGVTVLGNVMQGKLYRDLPPMRGKGIRREDESYYAQSDGKIEVKDGKIDIQNVHEIMGDVDMIIGKVEFFGDIIINGNVEEGVTIRAGRNIEIHGSTSMANLYAGGDIILSRGIQGGNKAKVSARGSVYAEFIEHTNIEAGGIVQANIIMNSNILAKDKVVATGKKGAIIGGYVNALKGVEASNAGNVAEIKTIIHCGYEAQTHEQLLAIKRQETDIKAKIAELVDTMTEALREKRMRGAQTSEETEKKILGWNKMKDQYFQQLDKVESERKSLEEMVEQSKGSEIKIDGNIYRGVVICVNAEQMMIERNTCYMKYNADKGVIEGSVIIHN
ncbi:MAG: FapA family protein [Bacillus sp. (in: Bacteria)]|nr:FapA family protein [Bacillus sp. (in: firmicutes)]MCM1426788.1 FapA family protein [Eubacterium sp.]